MGRWCADKWSSLSSCCCQCSGGCCCCCPGCRRGSVFAAGIPAWLHAADSGNGQSPLSAWHAYWFVGAEIICIPCQCLHTRAKHHVFEPTQIFLLLLVFVAFLPPVVTTHIHTHTHCNSKWPRCCQVHRWPCCSCACCSAAHPAEQQTGVSMADPAAAPLYHQHQQQLQDQQQQERWEGEQGEEEEEHTMLRVLVKVPAQPPPSPTAAAAVERVVVLRRVQCCTLGLMGGRTCSWVWCSC